MDPPGKRAGCVGQYVLPRWRGSNPQMLQALGAEYLERSRPFRLTDRPMFVDKLPSNWLNVGFIKLILPNAKIIDARRHPLACGFSNFKQHYATGSLSPIVSRRSAASIPTICG